MHKSIEIIGRPPWEFWHTSKVLQIKVCCIKIMDIYGWSFFRL